MRLRLSSALLLSLGLHALPCWWGWPSLLRPNPSTGAVTQDPPAIVALNVTVVSDKTAQTGAPRVASAAAPSPDLAARDRMQRARTAHDRLRTAQRRTLNDAAAARKTARTAAITLREAIALLDARRAQEAERADLLLTSSGTLRIASLPAQDAAKRLQRATADQERAREEARTAADRASRLEAELTAKPDAPRPRPKRGEPARGEPARGEPAEEMHPEARINAERARADAAARQALFAEEILAEATGVDAQARLALAAVEQAAQADREALDEATTARAGAERGREAADDRLAEALATATQTEKAAHRAENAARAAPTSWVKVPEPNAPHYMASTLAAPARSKSAKESASSALSASGDPVARPGSLVPAEGLDPSPSASGAPSSGGRTGLERMQSAGDEKAVGVTVERTGSAVPANLTSGTDTKAQRVPVTGPRVNGTGSEGAGAAGGPLIFVRTAGERPAAWNPTARFIGAQSVHSTLETRAPTSTTADVAPVMALPETPIPGMAIPAIVTQGDPDTHYADSAHMTADVSPKPQRALPDLESAGRAADGFALFLLDERASTSRRAPGLEPALRPSPTVTALPQPASPRRESLPAALSAAAPLPAIALTDDAHEPAGSLAVLPEDVAYGAITAMSVSAHPLADWMTDLDDALRGRWIYPPDLRALGVEGTVEVSFNVLPNGRITDVGVTRADADPALVFAALASLPPSVTAPPPGWGRLGIRYTYRYRAGG